MGPIDFDVPWYWKIALFICLSGSGWLVIEALLWLNDHLHLTWGNQ